MWSLLPVWQTGLSRRSWHGYVLPVSLTELEYLKFLHASRCSVMHCPSSNLTV